MNPTTKVVARIVRWSLVLTVVFHPHPGIAQQAAESRVVAGGQVYANMCGRCHRPRSPLERTDRDWLTIVTHMRVRANMTGLQARDVLEFLRATNGSPSAPTPPGATATPNRDFSNAISADPGIVMHGKALATSKACVGCHTIGAQGGQVGPSLNGVLTRRTAAFVRQKLSEPSFNNPLSMMPNFGLTPDEIDAIVAYLSSVGGQ